jgi:hypothetical protein
MTPPTWHPNPTKNEYKKSLVLYYSTHAPSILQCTAVQQSKATQLTKKVTKQLLHYCHTHPNAITEYRASDMQLKIHSDASYLAEPKGRSRGGGHYYLGGKPSTTPEAAQSPLLDRSNVIKNVMGSAAEAEVGSVYDNLRQGVPLCNTIQEMGYPQPPTPLQSRQFHGQYSAIAINESTVQC